MKLFISFLIINFFIIDGIQNVPVIHPIHVQTIPLHPVTVRLTSAQVTTRKPIISPVTTIHPAKHSWWYWSSSTQFTNLISSSASFTVHYYSSWWEKLSIPTKISLYLFLAVSLIAGACKGLDNVCKSSKQKPPCKESGLPLVKNKIYISTIDDKREESPPSYVEINNA
ncbi:unnamed protein product [Rotaria sordida]|uniref:Uncharacterized protein n=1 Tax=Rotaria sordida TaxID=392033 RepID=A0A813NII3_9BILA|nr:unnamed protein product [Rotaria sordida]CAF0912068.1 unnamed protein product [Rotaria sordida]CAF3493848.1 unnamed protein product [Rotaria sordida]CAF3581108.1 unnamed protein product [Rotaria sordida]